MLLLECSRITECHGSPSEPNKSPPKNFKSTFDTLLKRPRWFEYGRSKLWLNFAETMMLNLLYKMTVRELFETWHLNGVELMRNAWFWSEERMAPTKWMYLVEKHPRWKTDIFYPTRSRRCSRRQTRMEMVSANICFNFFQNWFKQFAWYWG